MNGRRSQVSYLRVLALRPLNFLSLRCKTLQVTAAVTAEHAAVVRLGSARLLGSRGSCSWLDYLLLLLLPCLLASAHLTGCCSELLGLRTRTLRPSEPRCSSAAAVLPQLQCFSCILVLISTDNIPTRQIPADPILRLKQGQNFSPSSPPLSSPLRAPLFSLIPGFTSSALRKFNCNLGLDKILLLQKLGATW